MRMLIHEIRNQLAVVMANVEAVADGKIEPTESRLKAVLQSLAIIDALIDCFPKIAVSTFSFDELERAGMFNVCNVIAITIEGLKFTAERKGVMLNILPCDSPGMDCYNCVADSRLIGVVVSNIVLNAIAYTPPGGTIKLECHHRDCKVSLIIEDTGSGISDDEMSRIFKAGYRGTASTGTNGSGLGLTFVKRYLESQGGSIRADRLAQGTAFTLEFSSGSTASTLS